MTAKKKPAVGKHAPEPEPVVEPVVTTPPPPEPVIEPEPLVEPEQPQAMAPAPPEPSEPEPVLDLRRPVALVRWGGVAVVELADGDSRPAQSYSGSELEPLIAACTDAFTLRMLERMNLDTQARRAIGARLGELGVEN